MTFQTVFVHGYNYDITGGDDPDVVYNYWRQFSRPSYYPFTWQSKIGLIDAWKAGHLNTYYWAWWRAISVSSGLIRDITNNASPVDIICHSLGSRVVLHALQGIPNGKVKRVLIFNGADSVDHARISAERTDAEIMSVQTKEDRVLRYLGTMFTPKLGKESVIGYNGMKNPPSNWKETWLSERADGPGIKDHDFTFKNPELWPMWRSFLNVS